MTTSPFPNNEQDLNAAFAQSVVLEPSGEDDALAQDMVLGHVVDEGLGRTRRDIVTRASLLARDMIRFVVSPDGELVPDLAQKLPGRGLWVRCDKDSLEEAIKKNLFARAAKRSVKIDPNIAACVHQLLRQRCLEALGLARREGLIITGFEKVAASIKSSKAQWLIEASNSAEDGRKKLLNLVFALQNKVKICGNFNNDELSLALGLENVIHVAILGGKRCERWSFELKRLSGFELTMPQSWQRLPHPPTNATNEGV